MRPALSERRFSQGSLITSLPHHKKTDSWAHGLPKETHILHFCREKEQDPPGALGVDACPAPLQPIPLPLPRAGPAPVCVCCEQGDDCRGPKGRGRAVRWLRVEARARAFLCGSWHMPDWFCQCYRRSGRSQPGARLGGQSQPGAAADGAHLAPAGRVLRALRRAEVLEDCSPWVLGSGPNPALPAPHTLATVSLEATPSDPAAPSLPALPTPRPSPRRRTAVATWASVGRCEPPCSCCSSEPGSRRATT